jgi:ABC-type bacteriocin/lantibiotic exporter with double-glycine peptidase domain
VANTFSIPHHPQTEDGFCLPACAQMALGYLDIVRTQAELAHTLQGRAGFGAPARNILNLRSRQIQATYQTNGTWEDIHSWLQRQFPVIACIQAGELPHWRGIQAQHAVVVVSLDENTVHLHDPALDHGPVTVPTSDFWLAWDEMEGRYAVLTKRR